VHGFGAKYCRIGFKIVVFYGFWKNENIAVKVLDILGFLLYNFKVLGDTEQNSKICGGVAHLGARLKR